MLYVSNYEIFVSINKELPAYGCDIYSCDISFFLHTAKD